LPDEKSNPFYVLDYARTAEQVAAAAKSLDALFKEAGSTLDSPALNKGLQDLGIATARAKADAKSILNHAFFLGAGLILLTFACMWVYRRLVEQEIKAGPAPAQSARTG